MKTKNNTRKLIRECESEEMVEIRTKSGTSQAWKEPDSPKIGPPFPVHPGHRMGDFAPWAAVLLGLHPVPMIVRCNRMTDLRTATLRHLLRRQECQCDEWDGQLPID